MPQCTDTADYGEIHCYGHKYEIRAGTGKDDDSIS